MEVASHKETSENSLSNIYIESEQTPLNSDILNTNFVINNTDSLELSLKIEEKYGLRTCLVELERCDKIWETIQLIRHLQDDPNIISCSESNLEQYDENIDKEYTLIDRSESSMNDVESNSSTATNAMTPYIKYQPVLNNGNTALPNFQFSVQRTRVLYPCLTCGKQYSHTRSLREHSERIHNIIIPFVRKKSENLSSDSKNNALKSESNVIESVKINEDKPIESKNINKNFQDHQYDEKSTDSRSSFHLDRVFQSEIRKFSCPFCDKCYKDKYTLNKHIKTIHGKHIGLTRAYNRKQIPMNSENACKIRRIKQSRSLDVHRCKTCGKHFYSSRNIRQHSRKVHGIYVRKRRNLLSEHHKSQNVTKSDKNYIQTTRSLLNVTNHEFTTKNASIKKNLKPVRKCPVCNKLYRDHLAWKNHCKKEHGVTIKFIGSFPTELENNNYDCKICNKKFYKVREIIKHYKIIHHRRLRYKCEICKSLFYDVNSLIKHSSNVHKIFLLLRRNPKTTETCNICGISCIDQNDLEMHMKEDHCNKRTREKSKTQIKKKIVQKKMRNASITSARDKLRKKEKINYNGNDLSTNQNNDIITPMSHELLVTAMEKNPNNKHAQFLKNPKSNKNISTDILYLTNCILCENRKFKHIRKHFMEYHKVRNPEALIAQCSKTPINNFSHLEYNNDIADTQDIERQNLNGYINNLKLKKSKKLQHRNRKYPGSERFFVKISRLHEKKFYVCKYCPFSSNNYDAMRADEKKHRREGITSETKPLYDHSNKSMNKKRKRESVDNRNIPRRRLSPSIDQIRTTRASAKIKEQYYHMCSICSRTFRSAEILKSHKISCKARINQSSIIEVSDTRASSDRDSGIGISITIKKKNDSYEIVNRDNNEEKSNESINFQEKPNHIIPLNNSSNILLTIPNNIDEQLNECFEYSKHHEVIKIQQAEDFDVDIVSDLENQNNIISHNQETQSSADTQENFDSELNNRKNDNSDKLYQVLPLKTLCQKVLTVQTINNQADEKNKQIYKCNICSKVWPSPFSLAAHKKIHLKVRRRIGIAQRMHK